MSEEQAFEAATDAAERPPDEPVRTGGQRVDAVVDAVSDLAERPVE